jgi:hypothetical protein
MIDNGFILQQFRVDDALHQKYEIDFPTEYKRNPIPSSSVLKIIGRNEGILSVSWNIYYF